MASMQTLKKNLNRAFFSSKVQFFRARLPQDGFFKTLRHKFSFSKICTYIYLEKKSPDIFIFINILYVCPPINAYHFRLYLLILKALVLIAIRKLFFGGAWSGEHVVVLIWFLTLLGCLVSLQKASSHY